jgi:hypothetical protein
VPIVFVLDSPFFGASVVVIVIVVGAAAPVSLLVSGLPLDADAFSSVSGFDITSDVNDSASSSDSGFPL